jgi:hypothetical protein
MPSLIAPNVVRLVATYESTTPENQENVFHVHKASPWTPLEIDDLIAAYEAWETAAGSARRGVAMALVRITATDLTSFTAARSDAMLAAPIVGQKVNDLVPSNVTFALKANIGERGKGRNGRCFWIGMVETDVTGDRISLAEAQAIQLALNTLLSDVSAAVPGADVGVLHTRVGGVPITPATFTPTRGYDFTDLFVDSQRDRLPGHKKHKRPTP